MVRLLAPLLNLKMTGVPSLSHRPFNAQRQASLSRQVNQLPHLGLPYPCSDAVVSWSHLSTKQQLLIQKRLALKQPGLSREDGLSCSAALQFVPKGKLPLILRLHKTAFLMKSTKGLALRLQDKCPKMSNAQCFLHLTGAQLGNLGT